MAVTQQGSSWYKPWTWMDREITPAEEATIEAGEAHYKSNPQLAFKYPEDLGTKKFPNMVKFYINAKKVTAENSGREYNELPEDALDLNQNRAGADNYERITKEASFIAGSIGGYFGGKALAGQDTGMAQDLLKGAGTGLVAMGAMAMVDENQETVRLKETISLYVPQSVVAAYTANWDEVDLGPFAGQLGSNTGSISDLSLSDSVELGGRGAIAAAANVPAAVGVGDLNLGNLFEATSKKVGNPYKEQLFKSMGFRQFSFSYVFSPKNEKEFNDVEQIISLFKENMHPDVSEGGMFLIYPSEFSIEFHHVTPGSSGSQINTHLPRISSCALKNQKVTYGPDGMLNTFRNSHGRPTEITMELQFVELETLTAKRIRDGRHEGKGEF